MTAKGLEGVGAGAPDAPRGRGLGWRFAAPAATYALAGRLVGPLAGLGLLLLAAGLWVGLALAPTDFQQGEAYRIIFVHVPTAWAAMVLYLAMAFWGGLGLVLGTRVSFMMMQSIAPTGALLSLLCLWTGALWGAPTWGTWWAWDARNTSVLLLLFLYLGFMALQGAIDDTRRADRAGALLALVGVVNVPVIYFSVRWWNTLHQGASVGPGSQATMASTMLLGLLLSALGVWLWSAAVVLRRLRCVLLEREAGASWVQAVLAQEVTA